MYDLEHFLPLQLELGETPIWVPEEKALYWVDIPSHQIFRMDYATGKYESFLTDMPVRGLCRRASGGWLVITDAGLGFWEIGAEKCEFIVDPYSDTPGMQFNDGMVDRKGRFYVGSYNNDDLESPAGSLYRVDADRSLHKLYTGLAVSNGIGLSPDNKTLYVVDMFAHRILAFDYDEETGDVGNRRIFVDIPEETGLPDGLTVDSEGGVWAAHFMGSRVSRWEPSGKLDREIMLPVQVVSCIGFGGENLDELYITTGWFTLDEQKRKEQPLAGDLFRVKMDVKGIPEPGFSG